MKKPDRDIVLFLGAGFSRNAGLPLMAEFGKEAKKQKIEEHAREKKRNAAPLLLSAKETFEGFQKLLEQKQVLTKEEVENMEKVFCIAEALHESGINSIVINGSPKGIKKLIEEIQLWLWKVYQQYPPLNKERKDEVELKVLEDFFEIIKNENIQNKITVVSTNYDIVYEYLSWQKQMSCCYPISWNINFNAGHGSKQYIYQLNEAANKTIVCKLHGSVNFFEDRIKDKHKLFVASDLGDNQSIGKSGPWEDKPALLALDSIWNIRNKYGEGFVPAIIPPTYAKLRGYSWQRKIWKNAFDAIVKAKKIIFIGYSMPESDGFIRAFFQGAFAMNSTSIQSEIYLIDPDSKKEVYQRYSDFFGSKFKPCNPLCLKEAIKNDFIKNILKV